MEPHVIKLCCNGCGSDLQVTDDVRFLTCNYCHSKLELVRDVSVTHTRVLEKIERTSDRIAGNLKVIELQNDLERLDRDGNRPGRDAGGAFFCPAVFHLQISLHFFTEPVVGICHLLLRCRTTTGIKRLKSSLPNSIGTGGDFTNR